MSKDNDLNFENPRLERAKFLSKLISNGLAVKEMVHCVGWGTIIEPMLDKMIIDVLGGKEDGRWHNGSLDVGNTGGNLRIEELVAYKRGLTDFHQRVYEYIDSIDIWEKEYREISKIDKDTDSNRSDYE